MFNFIANAWFLSGNPMKWLFVVSTPYSKSMESMSLIYLETINPLVDDT